MFQGETCISLKTSTPEIQANYFTAELLMPDDKFLELLEQGYTYDQIACTLGVHTELAIIKAQMLNSKSHNLNVPYIPGANFWKDMIDKLGIIIDISQLLNKGIYYVAKLASKPLYLA